jgi:hypothetical protein
MRLRISETVDSTMSNTSANGLDCEGASSTFFSRRSKGLPGSSFNTSEAFVDMEGYGPVAR